jgi:hypothetical protein
MKLSSVTPFTVDTVINAVKDVDMDLLLHNNNKNKILDNPNNLDKAKSEQKKRTERNSWS